jgi:predicted nucleic acid-binding protein
MCIIIDANVAGAVFQEPPRREYKPIFEWFYNRSGRLVFGGILYIELARIGQVARRLRTLNQAGIALQLRNDELTAEEALIRESNIATSNDMHVLALARLSGARVLCTNDQALQCDFKNMDIVPRPKGKIYKEARHSRLLKHTDSCIGRANYKETP